MTFDLQHDLYFMWDVLIRVEHVTPINKVFLGRQLVCVCELQISDPSCDL